MRADMDVTIAICTRNRAQVLDGALASVARMRIPEGISWELVIVNNASTDDTETIIGKYANSLPIRYHVEPRPGVSNARNRAVGAAAGTYMAWTDDDVLLDKEWLAAYLNAFRRWPEATLFGGRITPLLEEPVPDWLRESWDLVADAFARRDFGDEPLPLTLEGNRLPFGANFAARTNELRVHPFDPKLGPAPGKVILGEEMVLFEAILRSGRTGYWVPEAKVLHRIPQPRQTLQFLGSFYTALGRGNAYREREKIVPFLFGAPRWLWRRAIVSGLQYRLRRFTSRPTVWLKDYISHAVDRGALEYWLSR